MVVHLLREIRPDMPVLFLDTFHHFAETLTYRDELVERWKLNLINLRAPEPSVGLWKTSTDDCCARHKVGPLFSALEGYGTWFTGLRRQQSASRANLQPIEPFTLKSGKILRKVSPLAEWTTKDVWQYAKAHDIPLLPLYELGYVEHRLRAVHVAAGRPGQSALGTLGGPEARVRDSHRADQVASAFRRTFTRRSTQRPQNSQSRSSRAITVEAEFDEKKNLVGSRRGPGCNGLQCAPEDRRNGPPGCSEGARRGEQHPGPGTGMSAFVGQALLAGEPWPVRELSSFTETINYDQKSARAELNFAQPTFGGQQQNTEVNGDKAWNVGPNGPVPSWRRPRRDSCSLC